jgi:hypothetical protein
LLRQVYSVPSLAVEDPYVTLYSVLKQLQLGSRRILSFHPGVISCEILCCSLPVTHPTVRLEKCGETRVATAVRTTYPAV